MTSPKALGNDISTGVKNSVGDVSTGAKQIAKGDLNNGVGNLAAGYAGLNSAGLSQTFFPGETALTKKANAAAAQTAQDAADQVAAKKQNQLDQINTQIDETAKFRLLTPGRSQTILTTGLQPSGGSTLVTSRSGR